MPFRQRVTRRPTASTTPAQSTPGISGSIGAARALVAGAQAHVEHAIDGGGMNADADLARARARDPAPSSYRSTSGGPYSWSTIAFMQSLCRWVISDALARERRLQAVRGTRTLIDGHAGVLHDAFPFDRIRANEIGEMSRYASKNQDRKRADHVGPLASYGFDVSNRPQQTPIVRRPNRPHVEEQGEGDRGSEPWTTNPPAPS